MLVLLALTVSFARFGLPWLAVHYKDQLMEYVSELSSQHIKASSLSARWYLAGPELQLENVEFFDRESGNSVLQLKYLYLGFNFIDIIKQMNPAPSHISGDGIRLTLIRHKDASITVHGIGDENAEEIKLPPIETQTDIAAQGIGEENAEEVKSPPTEVQGDITAMLFQPDKILFRNALVTLVDTMTDKIDIHVFTASQLLLRNKGNHHQLTAYLGGRGVNRGELTVIADIETSEATLKQWQGKIYISTENLDAAWLFRKRIPGHYTLEKGRSTLEAWSSWKGGKMNSLSGSLRAKDIRFRSHVVDAPLLRIDWLSGNFRWLREQRGWRLDMSDMLITNENQQWPTSSVSIALRRSSKDSSLTLFAGADAFLAQHLAEAIAVHPPKHPLAYEILAAKPEGEIDDLRFQLQMRHNASWKGSAKLNGIYMAATSRLPALSNISASVSASSDGGQVSLDSSAASIHLKRLFRWPISLNTLQGDFNWKRLNSNGFRLWSDELTANTPDISTVTRFTLDLPTDGNRYMDLETRFHDGDAANAEVYYPTGIMKPKLVKWLDRAIVDAKVPSGTAILKGALKNFPFDKGREGIFKVDFRVEDATIDYMPEWPPVHDAVAQVLFDKNTMSIDILGGRLYNSTLESGTAKIPRLRPSSRVDIKGVVKGPLKDPLRLLKESPLKKQFAPLASSMTAAGESELILDFSIPLHPDEKLRFAGDLKVSDGLIQFSEVPFPLSNINGTLNLTDHSVDGKDVAVTLLGHPVKLQIKSLKEGGTLVESAVKLDTATMKKAMPELNSIPARGKSGWQIQLTTPTLAELKTSGLKLNAKSNLKGTAVSLPLTLGKDAAEKRPFALDWRIGKEKTPFNIRYGKLNLSAKPATGNASWRGTFADPQMEGTFTLPAGKQPTLIDFKRLDILFEPNAKPASAKRLKKRSDPHSIPELVITGENLTINGQAFGALDLHTRHIPNGIELSDGKITSDGLKLAVAGDWIETGGKQQTTLNAVLDAEHFGETLKALGLTEQIEETKGNAEATLNWDGGPADFSVANSRGTFTLHTGKGRFADAEPGVARLLGLANITALQRRLSLDFSDFTKKGFGYDKISGSFSLQDGIAKTRNFNIDAPAGDIRIKGKTNLLTQELDQEVTVIPHIHGALPIAGILAGGPAVGVALLIAGVIAGDEIDKIAKVKYSVTGPWKEPTIERIGYKQAPDEKPTQDSNIPDIH